MKLFQQKNPITAPLDERMSFFSVPNMALENTKTAIARAASQFLDQDGTAKYVDTLNYLLASFFESEDLGADRQFVQQTIGNVGQLISFLARLSDEKQNLMCFMEEGNARDAAK